MKGISQIITKMTKIAHISVRDIRTIDFVQNNITLIFFHEIFRINVESNFGKMPLRGGGQAYHFGKKLFRARSWRGRPGHVLTFLG